MPFAPISPQDEELKKKQEQGGQSVSGQSTSFSTGLPGQEAGSSKDKKSSGQYANIQSYLDANKDQADTMGSQISSNIESKGSEAKTAIEGFSSKAPKVAVYDPNAALGRAESLGSEEKQQYKQLRKTGGYSGPQDISEVENYQDVSKKASEAAQLAKNAASEQGQQELLKQTYARPNYSQGQNKLDQVLLQGSQGSKEALQQASQKYSALDKLFGEAQQNVGQSINQAKEQAFKNKESIAAAEKAARDALLNPIQQRAAQQQASNQALIARAQQDAQDEILSEDIMNQLGLSEGQSLYDLNLANYLNTDSTNVGLNQAANAQERAKYAALADLFDDQSMNQIDASGKAISPISLDRSRLEKDVASKKSEYDQETNNQLLSFDRNIQQIGEAVAGLANAGADDWAIERASRQAEKAIAEEQAKKNAYIQSRNNYRKVKKG